MPELSRVEGFEWDTGNETKNLTKHGVTKEEAESVFSYEPLIVEDEAHSQTEERWAAFGRTAEGRLLTVVFALRNNETKIRVISARDMSRRERKDYEERTA